MLTGLIKIEFFFPLSSFLFLSLFLAFLLFIHSTILAFITSSSAFWPRRELIFWKSHISWDVKLEQRPETTNCYSTFEIDNFDSVRSVDSRHGGHHIGSLLCCHILYKKDNAAKARRRESQRKNQVRFQGITYALRCVCTQLCRFELRWSVRKDSLCSLYCVSYITENSSPPWGWLPFSFGFLLPIFSFVFFLGFFPYTLDKLHT